MNSNFNSQQIFFNRCNLNCWVFFAYLCSWPPAPSPSALWGRKTHCASLWTWCHWGRRCWWLPAPSRGCPPSGRGSRGFSWQRANSRRAPSSAPGPHRMHVFLFLFFSFFSCKPFKLVDEECHQSDKDHGEQHQHGRAAVDGVGIHEWRWKGKKKQFKLFAFFSVLFSSRVRWLVQLGEVTESPRGSLLSLGPVASARC